MAWQIFGTRKSSDTRKAERFFKERGIKAQFIDLKEKEMSRNELASVCRATGGALNLLDASARDQDAVALVKHIAEVNREDMLFRNQQVLRQPIVRLGKRATAGYCPETWIAWLKEETAK